MKIFNGKYPCLLLIFFLVTALFAQTGGYRLQRSGFAAAGGNVQSPGYRSIIQMGMNNFGQMEGSHYAIGPITVVEEPGQSLPQIFELLQNYPNPFNQSTQVEWHLPQPAEVEVAVYSILGQRVTTLYCGRQGAGRYRVTFTGRDEQGAALTSGLYLCRMMAGSFQKDIKVLLVR